MENMNHEAAMLLARIFLGILFLFQGYDKVFRMGITKVIPVYKEELKQTGLPGPLITMAAYFTSWTELLCGALLLIGLYKYAALCLLGFDLILVSVAMGLIQPLWKTEAVFPRLVLILLLLLTDPSWDRYTLDALLGV